MKAPSRWPAASRRFFGASQSLAEGATEQAAGLEETSSKSGRDVFHDQTERRQRQQASTLAAEAKKAANNGSEAMGAEWPALSKILRNPPMKAAKIN